VPALDGSRRYPENVHFSHIMEHYIQLQAADIARNNIDLAVVVPPPVPVLSSFQTPGAGTSNMATRPPALSLCATQGLPLPGVATLPGTPVVSSRTILPDFIVGGYKVKSHTPGRTQDDDIYTSHKYLSEMTSVNSKNNCY
jgi:hypothetical protein